MGSDTEGYQHRLSNIYFLTKLKTTYDYEQTTSVWRGYGFPYRPHHLLQLDEHRQLVGGKERRADYRKTAFVARHVALF